MSMTNEEKRVMGIAILPMFSEEMIGETKSGIDAPVLNYISQDIKKDVGAPVHTTMGGDDFSNADATPPPAKNDTTTQLVDTGAQLLATVIQNKGNQDATIKAKCGTPPLIAIGKSAKARKQAYLKCVDDLNKKASTPPLNMSNSSKGAKKSSGTSPVLVIGIIAGVGILGFLGWKMLKQQKAGAGAGVPAPTPKLIPIPA
jgi:hypothetical protein